MLFAADDPVGFVYLMRYALNSIQHTRLSAQTTQRTGRRARPSVILLEDRLAPATLVVTNNLDLPHQMIPGSLRATIAAANDNDVIIFAPSLLGQTIQELPQGGPEGFAISKNIRIVGPGADKLTILGIIGGTRGINQRVFDIRPGIFVAISGLTLSNGNG